MISHQTSDLPAVDDVPLKVCALTDNDASARSAVRMLQRVSRTTKFRLTLLHLEQIVPSSNTGSLALPPLDSELFIVAMSDGSALPDLAKSWVERWARLRKEEDDCALVAFVTSRIATLDTRTPLVEYLGAIAASHGMTFFFGKSHDWVIIDTLPPTAPFHAMQPTVARRDQVTQRWGINE